MHDDDRKDSSPHFPAVCAVPTAAVHACTTSVSTDTAHLMIEPAYVQQEEHGDDDDAGAVKIVPGAVEIVLLVGHHLLGFVCSLQSKTTIRLVSLVRVTACAEHVRCMPIRWKPVPTGQNGSWSMHQSC